jgi:hypothetical protein
MWVLRSKLLVLVVLIAPYIIEDDFEQLKTQFEATGEQVAAFEKSGDDLCE